MKEKLEIIDNNFQLPSGARTIHRHYEERRKLPTAQVFSILSSRFRKVLKTNGAEDLRPLIRILERPLTPVLAMIGTLTCPLTCSVYQIQHTALQIQIHEGLIIMRPKKSWMRHNDLTINPMECILDCMLQNLTNFANFI